MRCTSAKQGPFSILTVTELLQVNLGNADDAPVLKVDSPDFAARSCLPCNRVEPTQQAFYNLLMQHRLLRW